ncbi:MAG: CBS domain-containing protein [Anaerolineales bacterium]|nr:CBS domain-containing protein [Anaerolineales bacterium]
MPDKLVRDLMHIGVPTCPDQTSLVEAAQTLLAKQLEALIVLDEHGHAIGLLSRREVALAYAQSEINASGFGTLTVADVMRADIPHVPADIPATAAVQLMLDQNGREIYVMHHEGGTHYPAAVLRFEDVLRFVSARTEADLVGMGSGAARKSPLDIFKERHSKPTG